MALMIALALTACGGGGGGKDSGPVGSGNPTPPPPPPAPTTAQRIDAALASCDASGLQSDDTAALLQRATSKTADLRARQTQILKAIYNTSGTVPNLELVTGHRGGNGGSSGVITPQSPGQAIPFIVSDNGHGMAAIAEIGSGRALAYGGDLMDYLAREPMREAQHLPLFKRVFTWLMTGQAGDGSTVPATIKYAQVGYTDTSYGYNEPKAVENFVTKRLGKQVQKVLGSDGKDCPIADPANTCWSQAELLVFGQNTPANPGLTDLVHSYLQAGKKVIFMYNTTWAPRAGASQVLNGMGMALGADNFWAGSADWTVSASRTATDSIAKADNLGDVATTLDLLAQNSYTKDFSAEPAAINGINLVRNSLAGIEGGGRALCATPNSELQRLLVLWADMWRPKVVYGQINRTSDAANFLRAYASDSWMAYNRTVTRTNPEGQGDWMPKVAQQIVPSSSNETIEITLPQRDGKTAIGRGALPAKAVSITIANAPAGVTLGVQTGYIRASGNPLTDSYARPRNPHSWNVPLRASGATNFIAPFGGPLFLNYSGATAGMKVTLSIKGVTRYAHFDFSTGDMPQAEQDAAMAALRRRDYGWSTAKFRSGEVQQTIASANNSIGSFTPKQYIVDRFQRVVMDTNHIVSGYNDMPLSAKATALCTGFSWDCTAAMHNQPGIQHFVSWIANCGSGCSGNPSDNYEWGLSPTWGWAHEYGHNTVQRWMNIQPPGTGGCGGECDNNTHSMAAMLRGYALNGEDHSNSNVSGPGGNNGGSGGLYKMIQDNRATGLTGEAQRADMQARLWGGGDQNPMRGMYMQIAYLYPSIRYGLSQPTADTVVEFMQLLSKGSRLVDHTPDANWTTDRAKYGMSAYPSKSISNHELQYVLSSKIIGRDLRNYYFMYGIPLSQTALDSVAAMGLPTEPLKFYALGYYKVNQLHTGQWLNLQGQTPAYPF